MKTRLFLMIAVSGALTACQSSKAPETVVDAGSTSAVEANTGENANAIEPIAIEAQAADGQEVAAVSAKPEPTTSGPKIVISSYRPPKVGTVFYWKNNWNSLPQKITHKVVSVDAEFSGRKAIQMDSIDGTGSETKTFLDAKNANLLGHKDRKGNPVVVFPKVEERLRFPMQPGDKWMTSWKSVDRSTQKTTNGGGVVKVIGVETLPIAGKNLKAMKIQLPLPRELARSMKHFIWYSPKFGIIVREQISNGTFVWLKELEDVKLPS